MYFFCQRGQENLKGMMVNHFKTVIETDGTRYIVQAIDEKNKNHGVNDTEIANQARMYEDKSKKISNFHSN